MDFKDWVYLSELDYDPDKHEIRGRGGVYIKGTDKQIGTKRAGETQIIPLGKEKPQPKKKEKPKPKKVVSKDEPKKKEVPEPEKEPEKKTKQPTKSGTGSAVGLDTPEKRKESLVAGTVTPVGKARDDLDFENSKMVNKMKDPIVLQGELKKINVASNVDNLPENTDIEKSTKNRAKSLQEGLEGFASAKTDEEKAQILNGLAQNRLIEMNFVEAEELSDEKGGFNGKKKMKVYPSSLSGLGKDDIVKAQSLCREMHRISNKYNMVVPISQSSKVAARSDMSGKHNEAGMVVEVMGENASPEAKEIYETNERKLMELQDEPGSDTAKEIIERNREINKGLAKMCVDEIKRRGGTITGAEQVGGLGSEGLLDKYGIDDKKNPTDLIIFYKDKDGKEQRLDVSAKIYKSDSSITMKNSGVKDFGNQYMGDEEANEQLAGLFDDPKYRWTDEKPGSKEYEDKKRLYKEEFAKIAGNSMSKLAQDPSGPPGNGKQGNPDDPTTWSEGQQKVLQTWRDIHGCGQGVLTSVAVTGGKEPQMKLHDEDHYCNPKMPLNIKINDTSCEILVGDGGGGESVKFNAKTEKDGPKALFYHVKGKNQEETAESNLMGFFGEKPYESLEGVISRMKRA